MAHRRSGTQSALFRVIAGFLWLVPVVFFAYFTLIARWPEGDAALAYLGPGPRIVVGVSVQASVSGPSADPHRSQVYIALPSSLRTLDAYAVVQDAGRVRVETVRFGLVIFGGLYVAWIGGSIWYVFRRTRAGAAS